MTYNAASAWKCSACNATFRESFEACFRCGTWGGAMPAIGVVAPRESGQSRRVLLADAEPRPVVRLEVAEPWHTALGGGLAEGSSVLVSGSPKCGKTTEALRLACSVPGALFVPCEYGQDAGTLREIADRGGLDISKLYVAEECHSLPDVLEALSELPAPPLAIVDSLSMLGDLEVWTQLRSACSSTALVCIMHVTKMGRMAGRNVLRHAVDTIVRVTKRDLIVRENRHAAGPDEVRSRR